MSRVKCCIQDQVIAIFRLLTYEQSHVTQPTTHIFFLSSLFIECPISQKEAAMPSSLECIHQTYFQFGTVSDNKAFIVFIFSIFLQHLVLLLEFGNCYTELFCIKNSLLSCTFDAAECYHECTTKHQLHTPPSRSSLS